MWNILGPLQIDMQERCLWYAIPESDRVVDVNV